MEENELFVIGIGASAGGLEAIKELFLEIPSDSSLAFVIVQHLSPHYVSHMQEIMSKFTTLPISTAKDGIELQAGNIYLNPIGKNIQIVNKKIQYSERSEKDTLNFPIDIFFHSLGLEFKNNATGIILSGTGSDGSRGIQTIKELGGFVIAQDPNSADFDGMPANAIATNCPDLILTPKEIGNWLSFRLNVAEVLGEHHLNQKPNQLIVQNILAEIRNYTGIDFFYYKKNTLHRRIIKRLQLIGKNNLYEYLAFLKSNSDEKEALKNDFLIGVTSFFRDKEAFSQLEKRVFASIIQKKKPNETIRIWIPGCSTGEEVYSIAILLEEFILKNHESVDYKIFATDISEDSLRTASLGVYNLHIITEIGEKLAAKYFIEHGKKLQIIQKIRKKIVFSNHNLISNPPFMYIDLISCRNLLIYFNPETKDRTLTTFRFSLVADGYLFLGPSESIEKHEPYFHIIDSSFKIYSLNATSKVSVTEIYTLDKPKRENYVRNQYQNIESFSHSSKTNSLKETEFYKDYFYRVQNSIIYIDKDYHIMFSQGEFIKNFLSLPTGVPELSLLKQIDPELIPVIKTGIRKLIKSKKTIRIVDYAFSRGEDSFKFNIEFSIPNNRNLQHLFLIEISIDDNCNDEIEVVEFSHNNQENNEYIIELEDELEDIKIELQTVMEQKELSNEELQSSNEELMSSNEELQSTNEELQSMNEELHTVNSELEEKNKQLSKVTNDLNNLLDNTDIAILFLDLELNIRNFSIPLTKHLNLQKSDIGRPITQFNTMINHISGENIIESARDSLEQLSNNSREIEDNEGRFFLLRTTPFLTSEKNLEGCILTMIDITEIKLKEKELKKNKEILDLGQFMAKIGSFDADLRSKKWNTSPGLCRIFGFEHEKNDSIELLESIIHPLDHKRVMGQYYQCIKQRKDFQINYRAINKKSQEVLSIQASTKIDYDINGVPLRMIGVIQDVSDFIDIQDKFSGLQSIFNEVSHVARIGTWKVNLKENVIIWDKIIREIHEVEKNYQHTIEKGLQFCKNSEDRKKLTSLFAACVEKGEYFHDEALITTARGKEIWIRIIGIPLYEDNQIIGSFGIVQDINETKQKEKALLEAKNTAEKANLHKNIFLANMSHEIRTPMNGIVGFAELLKEPDLSQEDKEKYYRILENNTNQLLTLIDQLIDMAKIEAKEMKINSNNFLLDNFLTELEGTYQEKIKYIDKDLKFYLVHHNKDIELFTDASRLQQIFTNLIDNAIKFTQKGSIEVGYQTKKDHIIFYVKDTGMGIPEDKMHGLFEIFIQLHYKKRYGGTGLGLALSKGLLDLMGGEIWVDSKQSVGSTFYFSLPLQDNSTRTPVTEQDSISKSRHKPDPVPYKGKRILIAEDEFFIREIYQAILKETEIIIDFAKNGKEAIDLFKEYPNYDLILMDIQMPVLDGFTALEKILEMKKDAKIIVVSAYGLGDEEKKSLSLGAISYVKKPITQTIIYKNILKWLTIEGENEA